MKRYITTLILLFIASITFAQQTPAPTQKGVITLNGATAHIGNGNVIEHSVIVITDGKITDVYDGLTTKKKMEGEIIDVTGKHVYPGFIALDTTLGLVEISAVKATNDDDEIGDFNPHIEAVIAYNAESKVVESMRPNGVLISQSVPQGGTISGSSSIMQLDAWNWEDAVVERNDGIHLNWPNSFRRGRWGMGEDAGYSPNKEYEKEITEVKNFIAQSKAYKGGDNSVMNLPYASMQGVMDGSENLYVHVDGEKEILDVLKFKKDMAIKNVVLVGAYRAYKVAKQIAAADVPVILARIHSLPEAEDDDYDISYKMAKDLYDAGVLVALGNSGEFWESRNIPFYAGQTVAEGMKWEDALKLITSNAAKIVGVDDTLGSIETGKDATLFISEGNALEMMGNLPFKAYINGRDISLETHQTELWHRYMEKYNRSE
ncbi:MAG: amidohydrolase [Cytophagaceae bacterium]|nr:amidohydrolase [Cytophagaceae bacterium]